MSNAETIRIGDIIMPPERELRLWMRRHVAQHNLPESALYLEVRGIYESSDKRGKWLHFKTQYADIWPGGSYAFTFKARPETPWQIVEKAVVQRDMDHHDPLLAAYNEGNGNQTDEEAAQ